MFQAHFFDVLSAYFGKENSLVLFWRTITENLLSSTGGVLHIRKTGVAPTFGSCCS